MTSNKKNSGKKKVNKKNVNNELTPEYQKILHEQVIDENGPGTILRDFETLLHLIGPEGMPVSSTYNFFPIKLLPQLNAKMAHPIEIDLKRPQQKSYPYIHGLYLVLRATGMTYVEGTGTKQRLFLDEKVLESWRSLNLTERYFTLLETWLFKGNPEIIGERGGMTWNAILNGFQFFQKIPAKGLKVASDKDKERSISYHPGFYAVALLDMFGFISVQQSKPESGKGWHINEIHRTPLGDAFLQLIASPLKDLENFWDYMDEMEEAEEEGDGNIPFGKLQPTIQPFFPEWRNNLIILERVFQDGVYIFKVSLGSIWRRIAIPGKMYLDNLSGSILNAFDFDFDHLYQFTYKTRFGAPRNIYHPYMDEPPWADDVLIGEIELKPNKTMTYLYDFGDNWEFQVKLERIDPPDPKIKKPVILESHGEAPEQYHSWDEDEGEEEYEDEGDDDDEEEDDEGEEETKDGDKSDDGGKDENENG